METTPLKDIVIIYHADCPDGFGAAFAAWKKFGDTASYIPWSIHHEVPDGLIDKELYIVDWSYNKETLEHLNTTNKSVVVIDHHQTAKEAVESFPQNIFDINHSGCYLAWQYFHPTIPVPSVLLYVEDHDIWNLALPEHREFNVALHQEPMTFASWDTLITRLQSENELINFIAKGSLLAKYEDKIVAGLMKNRERVIFEGHEVWAINESMHRSVLGNQLAELNESSGGTSLGIVYYRKDGAVRASLRSNGDVDVATMAEKYGGGGHKNASSIKVLDFKDLPFTFLK